MIDTHTDHLSPQAATWSRPAAQPLSIVDTARFWRALADEEDDARLAGEYRQLAATLDRYLPLRGGAL